jgi:hypothetical protein
VVLATDVPARNPAADDLPCLHDDAVDVLTHTVHCTQPRLAQVYDHSKYDGSLHLSLELSFPHKLVKHAGAPARAWLVLASPAESAQLQVTLVWQNKTATRLPEALWLRFKPGRGAVDQDTWLMHKLDGAVSPSEVGRGWLPLRGLACRCSCCL